MEVDTAVLGIGSRVNHPAYGQGVIIKLNKVSYEVCFITYGVKQVGKHYSQWEIIEAIPVVEEISFTGAEQSLIKILKTWGGLNEVVELGDRWNGGTLILKPMDGS